MAEGRLSDGFEDQLTRVSFVCLGESEVCQKNGAASMQRLGYHDIAGGEIAFSGKQSVSARNIYGKQNCNDATFLELCA